jgi:type IV pilus assembly protein PilO
MNQLKNFFDQLRGLDPNDPGRWPLAVRIGTVVIVFLLLALGGYYWFVWKEDRPKLLEARAKEGELMQTLETKARRAANLGAYRAQLAEMQQSFGAMLRQLPNKTEVPNLLVDISQTGLAAGLEEKLFQPQGENKKDFYAELPITIRLTGGYHEMGRFASGIAALPRIVTLHDIEITPPGRDRNAVIDTSQLTLNVTAKTYRYLDEEEQAPAPDAKGKKAAKKNNKKKAAGA